MGKASRALRKALPGRWIAVGGALLTVVLAASGCAGPATSPSGPTEPPGEPGVIAALRAEGLSELDRTWGCGEGFWISDAAQRVALFVRHADPGTSPPATAAVGDAWEVELQVGRDLMANWCDDVLEAGEPTPDVTGTFAGVAGTVEIEQPPGDPVGCPSQASARLTGLVVEGADGARIELGDAVLTNESWGCYAG